MKKRFFPIKIKDVKRYIRYYENWYNTFDKDGYKVFMDAKSMIYLKGMALDFQDGLQGKGFQFINPNATSTCGCGESFSMS